MNAGLDFGYTLPDAINFIVANNAPSGVVEADAAIRVPRGSSGYTYRFKAKDGDNNVRFTFVGDNIYTDPMSVLVTITNVPPTLVSPSGTVERPTPMSAYKDVPVTFSALVSDVGADAALQYVWYKDGTFYRQTTTNAVEAAFDSAGTFSVQAFDKDGGWSSFGHWEVTPAPHPAPESEHGDNLEIPASEWRMGAPELEWRTGGDSPWQFWWEDL